MTNQLRKELTDIFQKSKDMAFALPDNQDNTDIVMGIDAQNYPKDHFLAINGRYYPPTEFFS